MELFILPFVIMGVGISCNCLSGNAEKSDVVVENVRSRKPQQTSEGICVQPDSTAQTENLGFD